MIKSQPHRILCAKGFQRTSHAAQSAWDTTLAATAAWRLDRAR